MQSNCLRQRWHVTTATTQHNSTIFSKHIRFSPSHCCISVRHYYLTTLHSPMQRCFCGKTTKPTKHKNASQRERNCWTTQSFIDLESSLRACPAPFASTQFTSAPDAISNNAVVDSYKYRSCNNETIYLHRRGRCSTPNATVCTCFRWENKKKN